MSCGQGEHKHTIPCKIKKGFDKVVEWDKKLIDKFQKKFNLTDYQIKCIAFAKGFIIGAILL
tara:strand:- start:1344 stop:1529 length:186 start_codon:yes stop_codon:yes gene_type:complete